MVYVKRFLAPLLMIMVLAVQAQVQPSDSIKISLLTCGPGQELYSAFGHTGIRVVDYINRTDRVYNYGTFDDQQPLFYPHFVQGQMIYSLSVNDYSDFMVEYVEEHRQVDEQDLYLTTPDKQKLVMFLNNNALPQNCNYQYDFFWDNCATRPRDVFERILGSRLSYSNADSCGFAKNKTMHDMLRLYVHDRPWVDFGFDLILGLPCEVKATPRNQTFLPD
jgi:hypothetical protein